MYCVKERTNFPLYVPSRPHRIEKGTAHIKPAYVKELLKLKQFFTRPVKKIPRRKMEGFYQKIKTGTMQCYEGMWFVASTLDTV